jgi:hypothetical protein
MPYQFFYFSSPYDNLSVQWEFLSVTRSNVGCNVYGGKCFADGCEGTDNLQNYCVVAIRIITDIATDSEPHHGRDL